VTTSNHEERELCDTKQQAQMVRILTMLWCLMESSHFTSTYRTQLKSTSLTEDILHTFTTLHRLPYVCETQGSSNTYKLYFMICGDKNKRSFYFFQIGYQIVPFQNIYTDQPVSKICNVTRRWACRLDGRSLRIYKILMLNSFRNSQSGILHYKTVYSGRRISRFLCNKPETSHGNRILLQLFRLSVK